MRGLDASAKRKAQGGGGGGGISHGPRPLMLCARRFLCGFCLKNRDPVNSVGSTETVV